MIMISNQARGNGSNQPTQPQHETVVVIYDELQNRKIKTRKGEDRLRSGYLRKGSYTLKEGYSIIVGNHELHQDPIWKIIQGTNLWNKISTFLQILIKNKNLMWDNLMKRGFTRPSLCYMSKINEDDNKHLFNCFHLINDLWDRGATLSRTTKRDKASVNETILNQNYKPFKRSILNRIQYLFHTFFLWSIWKEMNQQIFSHKASYQEHLWLKIKLMMKETIEPQVWMEE